MQRSMATLRSKKNQWLQVSANKETLIAYKKKDQWLQVSANKETLIVYIPDHRKGH
jgi:putative AlgH/UPF0301 family transcriptional regulator